MIGYLISGTLSYEPVDFSKNVRANNTSKQILDIFLKIWGTNLVVATLLSYAGYFTGGILTIIISIWNGFILGIGLHSFFLRFGYNNIKLTFQIFGHIPLEVLTFCWFGRLGLSGWRIIVAVFSEKDIDQKIPSLKRMIYPFVLLTIAAIFESYLIYLNSSK